MGLVGLLKNKYKENYDVLMSAIHCIIHQEPLCGKRLKVQDMINDVAKTVNLFDQKVRTTDSSLLSFTTDSSLQSEYGELLHHTEVSWLTLSNRMKRFFGLREEIALFMTIKDNGGPQLGDPTFIANLAFLTNLTDYII